MLFMTVQDGLDRWVMKEDYSLSLSISTMIFHTATS